MIGKESGEISDLSNLVLDYQTTKNLDILDEICEKSYPIVKSRADFFSRTHPADSDDSFSDGCLALVTSIISNYRPKKLKSGKLCDFETYLRWRMSGVMLDGLRKKDHLPRTQRIRIRKLQEAIGYHESVHGRQTYTVEELAEMTGETKESVTQTLKLDRGLKISLSNRTSGGNTLESNISSDSNNPLDNVENKDLLENTYDFMRNELPRNYSEAMFLYYVWGIKMKEIGSMQNVSEARISRIISKGREKIKAHFS